MSPTKNIRQRHAIAQFPKVDRIGRQRANIAEWTATKQPPPYLVPPPKPSRWDRFADAAWRLHDGMPWVWATLVAGLLIASGIATVFIITAKAIP